MVERQALKINTILVLSVHVQYSVPHHPTATATGTLRENPLTLSPEEGGGVEVDVHDSVECPHSLRPSQMPQETTHQTNHLLQSGGRVRNTIIVTTQDCREGNRGPISYFQMFKQLKLGHPNTTYAPSET